MNSTNQKNQNMEGYNGKGVSRLRHFVSERQ